MSDGKDSKTDRIIQDALEEEQKEKRKRKGAKGQRDTLERDSSGELDARPKRSKKGGVEEEVGPIKESLVGKAQSVRAARRKGKGIGDTDILEDVEQAEELKEMPDAEKEKEHGIELEAFNLEEERQKGYFDEAGNYVENPEVDEDGEVDAWLQSDEAKVMDEETRKKIEAKQKEEALQLEKSDLSATDIARLQYKVSKILQGDETVSAALKRLAGPRKRLGRQSKLQVQESKHDDDTSEKRKCFEDLTEASTLLMEAGETDVYTKDKSYFQRAAAVYIDVDDGDAPTGTDDLGMKFNVKSSKAYEEADQDMFGDESSEEDKEVIEQTGVLGAATAPGTSDQGLDTSEYATWPVKELKRFCEEHGKSCQGITEKDDLVHLAAKCAKDAKPILAPAGYAFDPNSGLWWSSESQLYYDPKSGYYLNPADSKWYAWNSKTQQWVDPSDC